MTGEDYDANLAKIQKQFRFYNSNIYVLNKVPPHSVYGIHTPVFFRNSTRLESSTRSSSAAPTQKSTRGRSNQPSRQSLLAKQHQREE